MSLFKIAWRSIQERPLASTMTALSMALGVALVIAVLVFQGVIGNSFNRAAEGYDIIIGAKGGRLELVLNTVFHLGQPIENIHWYYYKEFVQPEGRFKKYTRVAIPYCLGDSYTAANQRFRIVGTTPELLIEERTTHKLGWGEIMVAHTLAASVDGAPPVADLYAMRAEGAGWGQIAAGLGISPGDALQAVRTESRVAVGLERADGKVSPVRSRGVGVGVKPGAPAPGARLGVGADVKVRGPKVKPGP